MVIVLSHNIFGMICYSAVANQYNTLPIKIN